MKPTHLDLAQGLYFSYLHNCCIRWLLDDARPSTKSSIWPSPVLLPLNHKGGLEGSHLRRLGAQSQAPTQQEEIECVMGRRAARMGVGRIKHLTTQGVQIIEQV